MNLFTSFFVSILAIALSTYLLPGVTLAGVVPAVLVVVTLGFINTFITPVLKLLTFPITLLTLGLFSLVINAVIILVVSAVVPGFEVDGFITALLFSVIMSITNTVLGWFIK